MPYLKINHDFRNPTLETLDLPDNVDAWLDACYTAIDCTTIEVIPTILKGIVLVIDEEGKLADDWRSRINRFATYLYGSVDVIVGDALLARISGEDLVPLTSTDIDCIRFLLS